MENLKIRVANEAESREAQELFFELGAKPRSILKGWQTKEYKTAWFALGKSGELYNEIVFKDNDSGICCSELYKEITLPELRDMVVLKRNDVGDATHDCGKGHERFGYLTSDGVEYIWSWGNSSWFKPKEMNFKSLNIKPIEKNESLNDKIASAETYRQAEVLPFIDDEPIGQKYDNNKPRMSLLAKGFLKSVVNVMEFGAQKYDVDNWQNVPDAKTRYYDAMQRHIGAWWDGETKDKETGEHHLAHAVCCAMFLMWFDGEQKQ